MKCLRCQAFVVMLFIRQFGEYRKLNGGCLCLLQIRIDKLVDKWSGSIEIGVTTHNPNNLDYPATMTNLRSGTLCKIQAELHND